MPVRDKYALQKWMAAYDRGRRKGEGSKRTSNRVLVYTTRYLPSGEQDHLLLFILDEPAAHEVAEMRTPDNKRLMAQLASCAADFIDSGEITA